MILLLQSSLSQAHEADIERAARHAALSPARSASRLGSMLRRAAPRRPGARRVARRPRTA